MQNAGLRSWTNLRTLVFEFIGDSTNWGNYDNLAAIEADIPSGRLRTGDVATADDTDVVYRYDGTDWFIYIHPPVATSLDFLKASTAEGAYGISGQTTYRYVTLSGTGYWVPETVYLAGPTREAWFDGDEDNTTLASQGFIVTQVGGGTIATDGTRIFSSCTTSSDTARLSRNNAAWNSDTGIWFRFRFEVTNWVWSDDTNTFAIGAQFSDGSNFVRLGLLGSILSGDFLGFNLFGSSEFAMNPTIDPTTGEILLEGIIKPLSSDFWEVTVNNIPVGFCRQTAGIASASKSFALGSSTSSAGSESAVTAYRDFVLVSFPTV